MITPLTLQDGLNEFLKNEVAAKYTLKAARRNGEEYFKNPQIVRSGWILPKSIDEEGSDIEAFPYIITRIGKVENMKDSRVSIVTMMILYGVYGPGVYDDDGRLVDDGSGYRDIWNLIESTRQSLFQTMTIDNKFRIIDDFFEAEILNEQVYPYWEGFCKTKWHIVFPRPQLDHKFY